MIPYIGDISKQDAELLSNLASNATRILEFGIGGSTQVLAWAAQPGVEINCVETDPRWIEQTKRNFEKLGLPVDRVSYFNFEDAPGGEYDFVFVDGVDDKRLAFALMAWQLVKHNGCMAFHDTRRYHDLEQALKIPTAFMGTVSAIYINEGESNITTLWKSLPALLYEDWNVVEGKDRVELDPTL